MRPRCSIFIATSLDGFIARRDGSIDWLSAVESPRQDYGYGQFFAEVDALVLGRRTYETALRFPTWPYGDKRCVVLTRGSFESRHGESFHSGPPVAALDDLHAAGVRRVYVDGGALIRAFLREHLIDDMTLSIIPVLLGDGLPLFDSSVPPHRLRLTNTQAFPTGLVQLTYDLTG